MPKAPKSRPASKAAATRRKTSEKADDNRERIDYAKLAAEVTKIMDARDKATTQPENPSTSHAPSVSAVNESSGSVVGEIFEGEVQGYNLSMTDSIALGNSVPLTIKNKIWADTYIDLRALIPSDTESTGVSLTIVTKQLHVEETDGNKKKSLTITEWMRAMTIYISIILEKTPSLCLPLLKYVNNILELHALGNVSWRAYDEGFRKARQGNPLKWEVLHPELMLKLASIGNLSKPNLTHSRLQGQRNFRGQRVCFKYNAGKPCQAHTCVYSHVCSECRQPHPHTLCNKKRPTAQPAPQSLNRANPSTNAGNHK